MATEVDPDWAKGHWRLGVVHELQKDFLLALHAYEKAVEISPEEKVFVKAKDKLLQRLGYGGETSPDGTHRIGLPPTGTSFKGEPPTYEAWRRLKKRTNNLTDMTNAFNFTINPSAGKDMKSEWWIAQGTYYWYSAMMRQLGELAGMHCPQLSHLTPKLEALKKQVQVGSISQNEFDTRRYQLLGLPPTNGTEFSDFLNGITHMGGDNLPAEMGGGKFIPSPPWLEFFAPQQFAAIQQCIMYQVLTCKQKLGRTDFATHDWTKGEDLVLSPAIVNAARSYWMGYAGQADDGTMGKQGTPEEVIEYCKKKLKEGITWEEGMRHFVGLNYRGTVLAAWLSRLVEGLAGALRQLKWARKFITLADTLWKVTENENYGERGVTFRKSFQVGVLWMELITAQTLRNDEPPKLDVAVYEFNLAQEIITIARKQPHPIGNTFNEWNFYTSFSRKPLAFACSYLASNMNPFKIAPDLLVKIMDRTGLMDPTRDDNLYSLLSATHDQEGLSVYSAIAETYKVAAMNQLPDDKETPILWWGYAAHLALAGDYKMKDLRKGINNAVLASQMMDEELWGPNPWKGSTYQTQALSLARHFQDKPDEFILPRLEMEKRPDGNIALFVNGQVLCMNLKPKLQRPRNPDKKTKQYLDTTEIEKEHGAES